MNIFPTGAEIVETSDTAVASAKNTKTFVFDFKKGEFKLTDGRVQTASEKDRICVWIEKLIRTKLDTYDVYEKTSYGMRVPHEVIGMRNRDYIETELTAELHEKIGANEEITSVSDISVEFERNAVHVTLTVTTIYDEEAVEIEYYG